MHIQGVSYVSERFQEAIRRLWGHNTKNLFNKSKLIRFTRLQKTYFFSIYPPSASTTAFNLLWALAQQLRIISSSRSAHTFLRFLLRLFTLGWGFFTGLPCQNSPYEKVHNIEVRWGWRPKTFGPELSSSGVRTIFNDSGLNVFGLHPQPTSMLWTLSYGEFCQGRPVKTFMVMWRVSKGASRKYELIWMKKQFVIAVLMLTRG